MSHELKLKKFNHSSLVEKQILGSGSYGAVQLLFHKELKKLVVGKYFNTGGDQRTIEKELANAEREAQILARINHENIVQFIGITSRENSFGIILEFITCGNLENLLLDEINIPLPWNIRSRFFVEFANALDYLHNHYPKKSFIHGDLKPQNILLTDTLQIKLADFGATAIAKLTGATSMTISGEGNTQHTPFYTAPEYLKNPTKTRCCSMDVYSYGMIGYEIITRTRVFEGSGVPMDTLMYLIKTDGQKPDVSRIDEISHRLKKKSSGQKTLMKLKEIVLQCWQTKAEDRPDMLVVKQKLDAFSTKENMFNQSINLEAKKLVKQRNLRVKLPKVEPPGFIDEIKQLNKAITRISNIWQVRLITAMLIVLLLGRWLVYICQSCNAVFLLTDGTHLVRFDTNVNFTYLPDFPHVYKEDTTVQNFVKVNNMIYVISCISGKSAIRINASDPTAVWVEMKWKDKYKNKKYIAFKDAILAIGSQSDYMNYDCQSTLPKSSAAYMYNTTTNIWTQLPAMSEARLGAALALFNGTACAVGGSESPSVECFNMTRNQWISLPMMNITRRDAAAVELNGELYVIGGAPILSSQHSNAKEIRKYYSRYALPTVEKYNPNINLWTKVTPLHEGRIYHAAAAADGRIYVVGGFSSVVEVYDPNGDFWCAASAIFNAQRYTRIIAIDMNIWSGAASIKLQLIKYFRKFCSEIEIRACFFMQYFSANYLQYFWEE